MIWVIFLYIIKRYVGEFVKVKICFYYGDILYDLGDVEILDFGFEVLSYIERSFC